MPHVEIGKRGEIQLVTSSSKKKSGKPRPEKVYVVDEEDRNQVIQLEKIVAQLEEQNKSLRKDIRDAEHIAEEWREDARNWEDKFEKVLAGKGLLEEKVTRRNEDLRKKNKEIEELKEDKKKLKTKAEKFETEAINRAERITVLTETNTLLKGTNTSLKQENSELTRMLVDDRNAIPRRGAEEPRRRRPYDNGHNGYWDLPLREDLGRRWGGARGYDSEN